MEDQYAKKEVMNEIHNNLHDKIESIDKAVSDIRDATVEIQKDGKKTLVQATKTNGRVNALENILWKFIVPVSVALAVYIISTHII
jgi:hypothetical protein